MARRYAVPSTGAWRSCCCIESARGPSSVAWYWANATWTISPTRSRPELLDRLVLANTLVMLGAMGCQKDIA